VIDMTASLYDCAATTADIGREHSRGGQHPPGPTSFIVLASAVATGFELTPELGISSLMVTVPVVGDMSLARQQGH